MFKSASFLSVCSVFVYHQFIGLIGCWENKDLDATGAHQGEPDMPYRIAIANLTTDKCASHCLDLGFAYAGLHGGMDCFCGKKFGRYGPARNRCNMKCGSKSEKVDCNRREKFCPSCGGEWAMAVIATAGKK